MKMRKIYAIVAMVLLGANFVFAQNVLSNSLVQLTNFFCQIIPALMLVAFLLAAVVYAAGQMASADQRARFHGWATSLLIGGITCGVIYVLAPWIIANVFSMTAVTCG
jgi:FtsH-binding integral membrane protein